MTGESSSPDCYPPTETAHAPAPEEPPGIPHLAPTDAATLAADGIASFRPEQFRKALLQNNRWART